MYRLLIADDEESIREGVADFVRQNCPEWDVAALARDARRWRWRGRFCPMRC